MKRMKKWIITAALSICSVFCWTASTVTALAERIEVPSENKVYYGQKITSKNIEDFKDREVTFTSSDLETPFLEFYIQPSQVGTEGTYTPDFEKININIENTDDDKDKMQISIYQQRVGTNTTDMGEQVIAINVAGGSQTLNAEYRGDATGLQKFYGVDGGLLGNDSEKKSYCGQIGQSFDGYVHGSTNFIDENGTPLKGSDYNNCPAIRLYYDSENAVMYTDVGGENYTTKEVLQNGKLRWRIRDFKKMDYKQSDGKPASDSKQPAWEGFSKGDNLKYTITFDNIQSGKTPSIFLSTFMGQRFGGETNSIKVTNPSKGQTGVAYKVPEPVFYNLETYADVDFEHADVEGVYAVKNLTTGVNVHDYRKISEYPTFTPSTAGVYQITYRANDVNDLVANSNIILKEITVVVEDNPLPVTITPNPYPTEANVNSTYDIGATCEYPSQTYAPEIYLTVTKGGDTKLNNVVVGESYEYTFTESGVYELQYTTTDYLGRTTEVTRNVEISTYYIEWNGKVSESVAIAKSVGVPQPTASDMAIYDTVYNQDVEPIVCNITVSYNGGAYQALSLVSFDKLGTYTVRYDFVYSLQGSKTGKAIRTILLYDDSYQPIKVNGIPTGTQLVEGDENGVEVFLKAVKGQKITVPYNYFDSFTSVTFVAVDGTTQDITATLLQGSFTFTPESCGVVEILAIREETDSAYRILKRLRIDVREKWIVFAGVDELTLPVGTDVSQYKPVCRDFYGNAITDYTTEMYYLGEKVEGLTANKLGVFEIVYTYTANNETASFTLLVTTFDEQQPVFTILSPKTSAYKNKSVAIAKYEVVDDSGLPPLVKIYVTKDGKEVNVTNNSFYASEKGEYVVTYYAVDAQGNAVTTQYTVEVKGALETFWPIGVGAILLLAGTTIFVIQLICKKKGGKR